MQYTHNETATATATLVHVDYAKIWQRITTLVIPKHIYYYNQCVIKHNKLVDLYVDVMGNHKYAYYGNSGYTLVELFHAITTSYYEELERVVNEYNYEIEQCNVDMDNIQLLPVFDMHNIAHTITSDYDVDVDVPNINIDYYHDRIERKTEELETHHNTYKDIVYAVKRVYSDILLLREYIEELEHGIIICLHQLVNDTYNEDSVFFSLTIASNAVNIVECEHEHMNGMYGDKTTLHTAYRYARAFTNSNDNSNDDDNSNDKTTVI